MRLSDTSMTIARTVAPPAVKPRPMVIGPTRAADQCVHCGARNHSVCNVIPLRDLDRLAATAVSVNIETGHWLIQEGDPAEHFL